MGTDSGPSWRVSCCPKAEDACSRRRRRKMWRQSEALAPALTRDPSVRRHVTYGAGTVGLVSRSYSCWAGLVCRRQTPEKLPEERVGRRENRPSGKALASPRTGPCVAAAEWSSEGSLPEPLQGPHLSSAVGASAHTTTQQGHLLHRCLKQ